MTGKYPCLVSVVICFSGLGSQAQNLVLNSSFEWLKKQACYAVTARNDNIGNYVYNWVAPTGGTSDIHLNTGPDSCQANLDKYGLKAHSGSATAGIYTVGSTPVPNRNPLITSYREYIQTKLPKPLTPAKIYYVELYVSPFSVAFQRATSCYTNNIGCYFSLDSIYRIEDSKQATEPLLVDPQINEDKVMNKPGEWHKISGCFTAQQAAQYLTIGNFFDDAHTAYQEVDQRRLGAYYYIDDVVVLETNLTQLPVLSLPDTTLCRGQSLPIRLPNAEQIQYQWQDGTTSPIYSIHQAGLYSVTASVGPCVVVDSFRVTQPALLQLPADTVLCRGTTLLLTPENGDSLPLVWNDGSTGPALSVADKGIFWVSTQSGLCAQRDSIRVRIEECPGLIPNVFTPNEDGVNDTFYIDGISSLPWRLAIYNRWGAQVYSTEAYQNDWKGDNLSGGVYYYLLSTRQIPQAYKGWVTIIK